MYKVIIGAPNTACGQAQQRLLVIECRYNMRFLSQQIPAAAAGTQALHRIAEAVALQRFDDVKDLRSVIWISQELTHRSPGSKRFDLVSHPAFFQTFQPARDAHNAS